MLVESLGSNPSIALKISAASCAEPVMTPAWSRLEAKAIMPQRDARPYVALMPVTPENAAGSQIEPPLSLAVSAGAKRATAAAPERPGHPPSHPDLSHGLTTLL